MFVKISLLTLVTIFTSDELIVNLFEKKYYKKKNIFFDIIY